MITRVRRWWRRNREHYRERGELLVEADRALRGMGVTLDFEDILLLCLRVGVLDLKNAQVLMGSPPTMIPVKKKKYLSGFFFEDDKSQMPGQEARQGPDRVLH